MSVKCKFVCDNVQVQGPNVVSVNFHAVTGDGKQLEDGTYDYAGENKQWSAATPAGALSLNLTNPAAFNQFEVGKFYYLAIEEVSPLVQTVAGTVKDETTDQTKLREGSGPVIDQSRPN